MPLDNSLNVSELLRRLGVKGDSLGSAPLLESLRMSLQIGDLSALVPPVGVPIGGAALKITSGVATVGSWTLECRSPGGLTVLELDCNINGDFQVWKTAASPFGVVNQTSAHDYAFGQAVDSVFNGHVPAAIVAPANVFRMQGALEGRMGPRFDVWVGPGEFLNIESLTTNTVEIIGILWKEYPGALNPG